MSATNEEVVEQFLEFSLERTLPDEDEKYLCSCINCLRDDK